MTILSYETYNKISKVISKDYKYMLFSKEKKKYYSKKKNKKIKIIPIRGVEPRSRG